MVAIEPLVLGVARGHPLSRRRTVTLGALSEEPMITLVRGSGLRALLENACQQAGFAPRITAETGELDSLVELAVEGIGVAVVPRSAVGGAHLAVVRITRPRLNAGRRSPGTRRSRRPPDALSSPWPTDGSPL